MSRKPTKYIVKLTDDQQTYLISLMKKGETNARTIKRANILLLSHEGKNAPQIAETLHAEIQTVFNVRKRFVKEGLQSALYDKPRPGAKPRFDSRQEAYVIALACSTPPDDRQRWTVRLLTEKIVQLDIVDEVSRETVRQTLKKTNLSRGKKSSGVYPR
jgi:transposase